MKKILFLFLCVFIFVSTGCKKEGICPYEQEKQTVSVKFDVKAIGVEEGDFDSKSYLKSATLGTPSTLTYAFYNATSNAILDGYPKTITNISGSPIDIGEQDLPFGSELKGLFIFSNNSLIKTEMSQSYDVIEFDKSHIDVEMFDYIATFTPSLKIDYTNSPIQIELGRTVSFLKIKSITPTDNATTHDNEVPNEAAKFSLSLQNYYKVFKPSGAMTIEGAETPVIETPIATPKNGNYFEYSLFIFGGGELETQETTVTLEFLDNDNPANIIKEIPFNATFKRNKKYTASGILFKNDVEFNVKFSDSWDGADTDISIP